MSNQPLETTGNELDRGFDEGERPSVVERRRASEADAKEGILDAAERCFGRAPYAEVSMRQIAETAEVSKSLVHYHYQSKEQLFVEAQLRAYDRLAQRIRDAVAVRGGSAQERGLLAFDALVEAIGSNDDLVTHAALTACAVTSKHGTDHVRRLRIDLKSLLHETMADIFKLDADALPVALSDAAELLWATLSGIGLQTALDDPLEQAQRTLRALRAIVALALDAAAVMHSQKAAPEVG